jgi:dolichyl-phosphate beta-glucosyltransferase
MVRAVGGIGPAASSPGARPATLSLVIPAYDEEARLPALLEVLATSAAGAVAEAGFELLEALVVDDGSGDRTAAMLASAAKSDPRLKPVLGAGGNNGKGAAVANGVSHACGEYVLLVDVDLSTPLEELPKLSAAIEEGFDVAIGSRAVDGAIVERGPAHRKLMGAAFNGSVRALTGLRIRDTQCGFKLMRTEAAKSLLAEQECPGFAFDVELLMRADRAGLRIAEVPVLYVHDSRSSVRVVSASLRMLGDVGRLAYRLRPRRSLRVAAEPGPLTDLPANDPD